MPIQYLEENYDSVFILIKEKIAYLNASAYRLLKNDAGERRLQNKELPDLEDFQLSKSILLHISSQITEETSFYNGKVNMMVEDALVRFDFRVKKTLFNGESAIFIILRENSFPTAEELKYLATNQETEHLNHFSDLVLLILDEHIISINESGLAILGARTDEEVIGQHIHQFIHPNYRAICKQRIQRVIDYGEIVENMEQVLLKVDGSEFEGEVVGYPVELGAIRLLKVRIRDISERKEGERRVLEAKARYETLVHNSIHGITIVQDGCWQFLNDAAIKLFEAVSYDELIGKDIKELLHPDYHQVCSDILSDIITNNHKHERLERQWVTLKGKLIYTEVVAIPITYNHKPGVQMIIQDITERKQAEKLALQNEKMKLVGQLAGSIAHEIRNPLTSLKGFVQLFRSGTVALDTYLDIMEAELERIEEVSGELLGFVRPDSSQFKQIEVQKLISDIQILLETLAFSYRVDFNISPVIEPLYILGVTSQLKQVLINLLKNGIEAMPHGGTLYITIEEKDQYVFIHIRDEGLGMSNEQLKQLGEPFQTTKEQGTGLGLSVCYRILENHQGQLNAQSTLGVGTTFTVEIPSYVKLRSSTLS